MHQGRHSAYLGCGHNEVQNGACVGNMPFGNLMSQMLHLSDPSLLKQSCYIGGEWIGAEDESVDATSTFDAIATSRHPYALI